MNASETRLTEQLAALKLAAVQEHYAALATEAAQKQWTHVDYLARLIDGEAQRRQQLAIARRLAANAANALSLSLACCSKASLLRCVSTCFISLCPFACQPASQQGGESGFNAGSPGLLRRKVGFISI